MNLKNQKDFFAGLLFMVMGVCFAWSASRYTIGTAARMGPGYFPLLLGALLTVLGGVILFKALVFETEDGGRIAGWAWRPVAYVVLANLAFGVLIGGLSAVGVPSMGLMPAVFVLTVLAARAGTEFRWKEVLLLALLLSLGSYVTFVVLLKLQLPLWPVFAAV
ncbi:tripartite tricarboxylate transporter TctB family protein [Rhodoferax sp. GW822-FHT02A01]|uniref:tripartite tricarboxylate transporter TctB family protein n=1 Tax=Rhodoferax sp. GW822-FHT02A01 TaxID=3141537 RepID=UPI00315DCA19